MNHNDFWGTLTSTEKHYIFEYFKDIKKHRKNKEMQKLMQQYKK